MEVTLIKKMKFSELRKELELKGLETAGLKTDLVKRLTQHYDNARKKRLNMNTVEESDSIDSIAQDCPEDCMCGMNDNKDEDSQDEDEDDEDSQDEDDVDVTDDEIISVLTKKVLIPTSVNKNVEQKTKKRGTNLIYNFVFKYNNENEALEAIERESHWINGKFIIIEI